MVQKDNRAAALYRRAEVFDFISEVLGILCFVPAGPGVIYTAALTWHGIGWLLVTGLVGLIAWACHLEAVRSFDMAMNRGRVISPAQIRYYRAVMEEVKRK